MTLKDFFEMEGESPSKLAAELGVSISTITRAAAGDTFPKPDLRAAITDATGGLVTSIDMLAAFDEAQKFKSEQAA